MQKKLISALCAVILSLSFSCSNLILPKRVQITGTVDLPARMGVADFGTIFFEAVQSAFSGEEGNARLYNVDYEGQTVQTFCIYIPIVVTETLNPTELLQTINRQLNDGISAEPREIDIGVTIPSFSPGAQEVEIDLEGISLGLPPVSLGDIAAYVVSIDFARCDGTVNSGIGMNFFLEEIIDGLELVLECADLNFTKESKPLKKGDNVFGNNEELTFELGSHKNNAKNLVFTTKLQSTDPENPDKLRLSTAGLTPGEQFTIMKGNVDFFQNWIQAIIDMEKAITAISGDGEYIGTFPESNGYFDLSGLGKHLDSGFIFEGMESKMYMYNPVDFKLLLTLEPLYDKKEATGLLYEGEITMDEDPLVLSNYLKDDETYMYKHLPGVEDENSADANHDVIDDIFMHMPDNLTFTYKVKFAVEHKYWVIYPAMFDKFPGGDSKITTALMIMLPMNLVATSDESVLSFPKIFAKANDLFGRDEVYEDGRLLGPVKLERVTMSINFYNDIFRGGRLFLDGDKNQNPLLFFPDGIPLNEKNITMDFTSQQIKIAQAQLIKPNLWVSLKKGDRVSVPKHLGIVGVKFDKMKASFNTGDFLE
jgi:hypothetical protein